MKTILLLLLVSPASVCPLAVAQGKVTALVEVKDVSGAVVAGAEVSVAATTSSETAKLYLQTNSNGRALLDLLPGSYELSVKSQGFRVSNQRVVITDGERPTFTVTLQVGSCPPGPCIGVEPEPESPLSEVKVTVVDTMGAAIPHCEVVFKSDSARIVANTGQDRNLVTVRVPTGQYVVTATPKTPGFFKGEISDFQVVAPVSNEITLVLKPNFLDCGPGGCNGPSRLTQRQPVTEKRRSWQCLYFWKCVTP